MQQGCSWGLPRGCGCRAQRAERSGSFSPAVCSHQQPEADLQSAPAGSRRLQVHVRREAGDRVVRPQLLLPLREHRLHHGVQGRKHEGAQAVPRRARLGARHPAAHHHAVLPLSPPPPNTFLLRTLLPQRCLLPLFPFRRRNRGAARGWSRPPRGISEREARPRPCPGALRAHTGAVRPGGGGGSRRLGPGPGPGPGSDSGSGCRSQGAVPVPFPAGGFRFRRVPVPVPAWRGARCRRASAAWTWSASTGAASRTSPRRRRRQSPSPAPRRRRCCGGILGGGGRGGAGAAPVALLDSQRRRGDALRALHAALRSAPRLAASPDTKVRGGTVGRGGEGRGKEGRPCPDGWPGGSGGAQQANRA